MDVNEEEVLVPMRDTGNSNGDFFENGHTLISHSLHQTGIKASLQWLDLRVFYVRVSKCVMDEGSMPEYLTLNHVPLSRDTLLEVNCVRDSIYSDGMSTLLKRDRLDKRSEEVTFVNTDSIRVTGSVMFEVFRENVLVLSGTLEFSGDNGFVGESKYESWSMNCESDIPAGTGFFKGNPNPSTGLESPTLPVIEVYVAGSFLGSPIILTRTLQISTHRRKQLRKGAVLESIPEYETIQNQSDHSSTIASVALAQLRQCAQYKPQEEGHCSPYSGIDYLETEDDGELTWFNAGVRVGVGIGLSICLGVGLIVRTYQGTTGNFTRRLL